MYVFPLDQWKYTHKPASLMRIRCQTFIYHTKTVSFHVNVYYFWEKSKLWYKNMGTLYFYDTSNLQIFTGSYNFYLDFMQFVKGEVQSRMTIILKERVKISLQIGAKMMKIG